MAGPGAKQSAEFVMSCLFNLATEVGGRHAVRLVVMLLLKASNDYHSAVIHPRHAAWLVGQQRLDDLPFNIGHFVTTHQILPCSGDESSTHCK